MVHPVETKKVTLEEFMQYPEVNVELLNGTVVREPTPTYGHQSTCAKIVRKIYFYLEAHNVGEVQFAPLDVFLGENVVQPDILFISLERLSKVIIDDKVKGAPDVTFEIVSPSNSANDIKRKFDLYQQYGIKEYFIVYPDDKTVVKYVLTDGKFHEAYREIGYVKSDVIGCEFNF